MDSHALIRRFLQEQTIIPLGVYHTGDRFYTKAGVVPFIGNNPMLFYTMKPVATHAQGPAPEFQICKGTRMRRPPGGEWKDMRDENEKAESRDEVETLALTALREGIEESGLSLPQIEQLYDIGPFTFNSAKTGRPKHMWLYAAQMKTREGFSEEVAPGTAECRWLTLAEFRQHGRADQAHILESIETHIMEKD